MMTIMVEIQRYLKKSSKVLVQLVGMQQEESQRRQQELSEDIALKVGFVCHHDYNVEKKGGG